MVVLPQKKRKIENQLHLTPRRKKELKEKRVSQWRLGKRASEG